jgi:TBC1 domain family protein 5
VKEWGWHEGLTAPSSRATTPSPSEPDTTGLMSKDDIPLAKEEMTPTPPSASYFQSTPMPAPALRSAPIAGQVKPNVSPSVPTVRGPPSPALPRGPLTAPPSRKETPHLFTQSRNASNPSLRRPSSTGTPAAANPRGFPTPPISSTAPPPPSTSDGPGGTAGDPLAGLGVNHSSATYKSQAQEVDPLLGLGIRR